MWFAQFLTEQKNAYRALSKSRRWTWSKGVSQSSFSIWIALALRSFSSAFADGGSGYPGGAPLVDACPTMPGLGSEVLAVVRDRPAPLPPAKEKCNLHSEQNINQHIWSDWPRPWNPYCIVSIYLYSTSSRAHQSKALSLTHLGGADEVVFESNCVRRTCYRRLHSNYLRWGSNPYSPCYRLSALTDRPPCHTPE